MHDEHTAAGTAFTEITLQIFRLSGLLVAEGDSLTRDLGLTSARWKVLGAIALAGRPLTVAQIARRMGLTRQSVQRIVGELAGSGHVRLDANPDHQRSPLVNRTAKGEAAYAEIMRRHHDWADRVGTKMDAAALRHALQTLEELAERLEQVPSRKDAAF